MQPEASASVQLQLHLCPAAENANKCNEYESHIN